jgi:hypothetical protein
MCFSQNKETRSPSSSRLYGRLNAVVLGLIMPLRVKKVII